ncbi:hypothetical protein WJX73_004067 [Symbiochloris irregularis]|uniref:NmrA-like domain-containing protein n=1 Tax=Symbiochloris irregularis TaxID=706552 RepID=A0AAW1NU97_9CHLO
MKPRVAVIGATGKQGGAVVTALLRRAIFEVVAVVRDLHSGAARSLAERGVELREGNLDSACSLEQAFSGCHGVFLVTDLVSCKGDRTRELQQGKNASDAANKAGVQHIVFSSLEDPRPGLSEDMPSVHNGLKLPGKMVKVDIEAYIKKTGPPASYLITSAYYENYFAWYRYQLQADGTYLLRTNVSTKPFCQNAVADIAESAAVAFERRKQVLGKQIPVKTRPVQDRLVLGVPFREWAIANKEALLARLKEATHVDSNSYVPYGFSH